MNKEEGNLFIPMSLLRNKELNGKERWLHAILLNEARGKTVIFTNLKSLIKEMQMTRTPVERTLKSLQEKGYIEVNRPAEFVERIKSKNMKGFGIGNKICEWCEISTLVLHKHHYPIKKSKGGLDVVEICPNCHHEFHFFEISLLEIEIKELYESEMSGVYE